MTSLSYQEKSLCGTLAANLIVSVPYFVFVARHAALASIVQTITILVILQIILQSAIAIFSRSRLTDERDREVEARGYRAGYFALVTQVLLVLTSLWAHALTGFADPTREAIHFINVLFGALVLAEMVKTITQLVAYRVGA